MTTVGRHRRPGGGQRPADPGSTGTESCWPITPPSSVPGEGRLRAMTADARESKASRSSA